MTAFSRFFGRRGGPEPDEESREDDLQQCPACGEMSHLYAVHCRHCGRQLTTVSRLRLRGRRL